MSDNEELQEVSDAELESMISKESDDNSSQADSLGNEDLSSLGSNDELDLPNPISKNKTNDPSYNLPPADITSNLPSTTLKEKNTTNEEVDSNASSDVESEVGSESESEVGSDVDSEVGSDVDSEVGSDVDSEAGSEAESEAGSEAESDAENTDNSSLKKIDSLPQKSKSKSKSKSKEIVSQFNYYESSDDESSNLDSKFDIENLNDFLTDFHPESKQHNYDEIYVLSQVVRNPEGIIVDDFHKTMPILTKYEKARILGQRAKQINSGNKPFIEIDKHILDGYLIAEEELNQKKLPFIIRRPIPGGSSEYWRLEDLEIL